LGFERGESVPDLVGVAAARTPGRLLDVIDWELMRQQLMRQRMWRSTPEDSDRVGGADVDRADSIADVAAPILDILHDIG